MTASNVDLARARERDETAILQRLLAEGEARVLS